MTQAKLSEANSKLMVALKENHAANERVNELTDLVAKYEADLQVATTIGEEEAKVMTACMTYEWFIW